MRSVVLFSAGKNFRAGADFSAPARNTVGDREGGHLYQQAVRLVRSAKPIVAAVQGAAVGGGLGLALVCLFERPTARNSLTPRPECGHVNP